MERQKQFKKGIDSDESRRRREDTTIQIRKTKKEERLNQRRRMVSGAGDGASATGQSSSAPQYDQSLQSKVSHKMNESMSLTGSHLTLS